MSAASRHRASSRASSRASGWDSNWPGDCRARLWLVRAPEDPDPAHLALLDPRERAVCERLASRALQARYGCAHALLRSVLSPLLDQAPADVAVIPGDKRRPTLVGESRERLPGLDFNLSGSGPWITCALGMGARVGVDVELGEGRLDLEGLAARLFTTAEQAWLRDQVDQHAGFCRLWALKESISKAHGEGVGLDFARLQTLPGNETLSLDLDALGVSGAWRVLSLQGPGAPEGELALALAIWGEHTGGTLDLAPPGPDGFDAVPVATFAEATWPG